MDGWEDHEARTCIVDVVATCQKVCPLGISRGAATTSKF